MEHTNQLRQRPSARQLYHYPSKRGFQHPRDLAATSDNAKDQIRASILLDAYTSIFSHDLDGELAELYFTNTGFVSVECGHELAFIKPTSQHSRCHNVWGHISSITRERRQRDYVTYNGIETCRAIHLVGHSMSDDLAAFYRRRLCKSRRTLRSLRPKIGDSQTMGGAILHHLLEVPLPQQSRYWLLSMRSGPSMAPPNVPGSEVRRR
jgi:hypothetical protein